MKPLAAIAMVALFTAPFFACAADASAGFASQSVFLSRDSVTQGDTVLVYANIANGSAQPFDGKVVFSTADSSIGSVAVTLGGGEARLVSISWQPKAGSQTVTAELQDQSGTVVSKESATFNISAPASAAPATSADTAVESSTGIQKDISSISPAAGSTLSPILSAIDSGRVSAAKILDDQLVRTQPKLLGIAGGTAQTPQGIGWLYAILWTPYFYLLTVLRAIVESAGFFYAALIILFMYLLYRIYRRMRPGYQY